MDPETQKEIGCHESAKALKKFFSAVFNESDNCLNDFIDNQLNEIEILIEIAKDILNASGDGFGPDLILEQVLRKC